MSNMYDWITEKNVNPLAGRCLHECEYCYVEPMKIRPASNKKYSGPIRLDEKVLASTIKGGTRFLCSCNDLFAAGVPENIILDIIDWAARQDTTWAIQTKNPGHELFRHLIKNKPANFVLGATIETNRDISISKAPLPKDRVIAGLDYVTIEPIMDFDMIELVAMVKAINPRFVNVGADSGGNDLPEPSAEKIEALIAALEAITEVRRKPNLVRITGQSQGVPQKPGV